MLQAALVEDEGRVVPGSDPNSVGSTASASGNAGGSASASGSGATVKGAPKEAESPFVTVTISELLHHRLSAGQWVHGDVVGLRITVYDPETSQRSQRDIPTTTASLIQVRSLCMYSAVHLRGPSSLVYAGCT